MFELSFVRLMKIFVRIYSLDHAPMVATESAISHGVSGKLVELKELAYFSRIYATQVALKVSLFTLM